MLKNRGEICKKKLIPIIFRIHRQKAARFIPPSPPSLRAFFIYPLIILPPSWFSCPCMSSRQSRSPMMFGSFGVRFPWLILGIRDAINASGSVITAGLRYPSWTYEHSRVVIVPSGVLQEQWLHKVGGPYMVGKLFMPLKNGGGGQKKNAPLPEYYSKYHGKVLRFTDVCWIPGQDSLIYLLGTYIWCPACPWSPCGSTHLRSAS